jgi:hypothetical protein
MEHAVCRCPLVAAARVRSQVSSCWTCGGQTGTTIGFDQHTSNSPPYIYIYMYVCNKTSNKRNILTIKQNTSGSRSG